MPEPPVSGAHGTRPAAMRVAFRRAPPPGTPIRRCVSDARRRALNPHTMSRTVATISCEKKHRSISPRLS